jgi:hypothetical protein
LALVGRDNGIERLVPGERRARGMDQDVNRLLGRRW